MANDQPKGMSGISTNPFAARYDNFIGGEWVAPRSGRYFDNVTPITGAVVGEVKRVQGQMTSNWHWMRRIRPRTNGARPRPRNAPTCC